MIDLAKVKAAWLRPRGVDDLLLGGGWTTSLIAIVGGLVLSFFLFGFWWPYWRIFDMDVFLVYEAFLLNDGLRQEYLDHPGYLSILLLGGWLRLLHALGMLDVHTLSSLPQPADAEPAWTAAVRAARVLSLVLVAGFVVTFTVLLRRLVEDWRIAIFGAFALAFSGGVAMHARIVRTELISAGLVVLALLVLLIAARSPHLRGRPLLIGLCALMVTLALENKVQAIVLIGALPVIVLPFGRLPDPSARVWRDPSQALPKLTVVALAAAALAIIAMAAIPDLRLQIGPFTVAFAGWIGVGILAFAILWRVPAAETLATMFAVVAGCALGLLALGIRLEPENVFATMNPVAHAMAYTKEGLLADAAEETSAVYSSVIPMLIRGFGEVLLRRTFVLQSSARPTIFLEWLVIAATIAAYRAGKRKLVLQVAVLVLTVWGFDTISAMRGLKLEYFIFTDPLVIIAAALLLTDHVELQRYRFAFQVGVVLFWAHVLVGLAEPVKHTFLRSKPLYLCIEHLAYTKRVRTYSFCPSAQS